MVLHEGRVYRCANRACAAEVKVMKASIDGDFTLTCCCSSVMKQPYSKPLVNRIIIGDELALEDLEIGVPKRARIF